MFEKQTEQQAREKILELVAEYCDRYHQDVYKRQPLILLPLGVVGAMALGGWTVDAAVQGVLVTGAAVYSNQIVKQIKKD